MLIVLQCSDTAEWMAEKPQQISYICC